MRKKSWLFLFTILAIFLLLPIPLHVSPLFVSASETVVYSEGFEASNGGYSHSTLDQWQWGTPNFTDGPAAAHGGDKCWGTNLEGNVPLYSDSYLTSQQIALPSITSNQVLRVKFYAWIAVDEMYDRGEFQVSSNNLTYATEAELFHIMQGNWSAYDFDVSSYAGGNIYLRFRLYADGANAFTQSPNNMSGLYIDDVKITRFDQPTIKTTLSLQAYENQYAYASCPWIFPWNGSTYVQDNDVYSTARGAANEYTDYYTLNQALVPLNGKYSLDLREITEETSYTDLIQLVTVDHAANTHIATDENGNIYAYANPVSAASATDGQGNDVTAQLSSADNSFVKGFDGNTVTLDFSNVNTATGATLVLQATGFIDNDSAGDPTNHPARIFIQTQDSSQQWVTRNIFYPRNNPATGAYNLAPYLTESKLVRLCVSSCHTLKYHAIDYVALDNQPQVVSTQVLSPISADHSANGDVCSVVANADSQYVSVAQGEKISLSFNVPPQTDSVRDFVFVTKGYYEPSGTYFIYTWDGNNWVERDGWSVLGSGDQTHVYDMSLFLPDPSGQYRVRIWQDFWYEDAGINCVTLIHNNVTANMASAYDQRKQVYVTNLVNASDSYWDEWSPSDANYPYNRMRNRFVDINFTFAGPQNNPPSTNPVIVTNLGTETPVISWAYEDLEGIPQAAYEVEVWTGPSGTGSIIWDPSSGIGDSTSTIYKGSALVLGETYYARAKAFDGLDWGQWSEIAFTNASAQYNKPSNTDLGPVSGESGRTPSVNWFDPITFTYIDAAATSVDIRIELTDGGPAITGTMSNPDTSLWTYITTFYPRYGMAYVTYTAHYPTGGTGTAALIAYVDPAGYIYDATSNLRIKDATVWLQRPDGLGDWENVPTGSAIMVPDTNPLTTGVTGQYQWDTIPGTYRVHVEAQAYLPADSIAVTVPPAVTDLNVGLTRNDNTPPTTTLTIGTPKYVKPSDGTIYVNSTTTLSFAVVDDPSGIGVFTENCTAVRFRNSTYATSWATAANGAATVPSSIADGAYTIDYNSSDRFDNEETTKTQNVVLDNTAPSTTNNCSQTWLTSQSTVTLSSVDSGSGLSNTYYKLNSGTTKTVAANGQPTLTTEALDNALQYWATDNLGNTENPKILHVGLDLTDPTGTIVINSGASTTSSTSVTLTLTANDPISGVSQIRLSNDATWDTELWESFAASRSWTLSSGDGAKTVYYQVKDTAGRLSQTYTGAITLTTPVTPTPTPTTGGGSTATPTPHVNPTPSPTATATPTPTITATPTATPTSTPQPTDNSTMIIIIIVVVVIFAAVGAGIAFARRRH